MAIGPPRVTRFWIRPRWFRVAAVSFLVVSPVLLVSSPILLLFILPLLLFSSLLIVSPTPLLAPRCSVGFVGIRRHWGGFAGVGCRWVRFARIGVGPARVGSWLGGIHCRLSSLGDSSQWEWIRWRWSSLGVDSPVFNSSSRRGPPLVRRIVYPSFAGSSSPAYSPPLPFFYPLLSPSFAPTSLWKGEGRLRLHPRF